MADVKIFSKMEIESLKELQTPCFIYDLAVIREKIQAIKKAFDQIPFTQYYPLKANPCPDIVRFCLQQGLGIDACSMGDMEIAGILNIPSANISFTGVGLNEQEMRFLHGKTLIPNLGSIEEVKRWGRLFPGSQIGLRISMPQTGIKNAGDYSIKMGILDQDWPLLRGLIDNDNLEIVKIHRHESKGSIFHEELLHSFSAAFHQVPGWAWKKVKTVNFGGGWGLPYLREGQINLNKLVRGIKEITHTLSNTFGLGSVDIEIEPGEFLVGECGILLSRVIDVRKSISPQDGKDIQVVVLDTPFPPGSGFRNAELLHPVTFLPDEENGQKEAVFTKIYGRSNTSLDTINKGTYLPAVEINRLAQVLCVGAYVPVLMTYFNEQDIPPEYVLSDGTLVRSRERLRFKSYYENAYIEKKGVVDNE